MGMSIPPQDGIQNRIELEDGTVGWMEATGNVRVRFGFGSVADAFALLCELCSRFKPIASRVFPDDSLIIILYDIALAICDVGQTVAGTYADGVVPTDEAAQKEVLAGRLSAIVARLETP